MGRGCNLLLGSAEQLLLLLHALLIFYASVQFNTASASELIIHQTRLFTTRQKWRVQRVATVDEWDQADFEGYWFECYKNNVLPNQSYVNWERLDSDVDITDGRIEHNGVTRLEIQPSDVLSSIGYYVCIEADNESNREYLNITNQNPGLVVESDTVEALAGSDVNLTVYISSATSNSMLTLLQWRGPPYDNEGEPTLILEEPPDVQELPVTPRTLTLMNVDCSRAGTYNFTVYVDSAGQNVKGDIAMDLHILVPVNIISSPSSSITINEWKEISLVCTADGSHPITLTWSRDDTALTNIDVRIDEETNTVTNTLIFSAIRYDDSGTYQCTASNSLTTISSNDTTHVIINVTHQLAVFIMEDEIFAQNGDTVIIQASIHSLTDINSILWYRNQTLLESESNVGDTMTTLTITDFQNEDVGMYVVMVTNSDDSSANDSTVIMFPEPTSAVMDPEELIVDVGDRVKAVCMGDGSGLLEIKWSLEISDDDDETLPDGIQTEGSILSIAMATLSHNNVYICTVSSQFSMSDATFDLKVFDPLIVEIAYINDFSTEHILSFHHGNGIVPSFKCVVNGSQNVSLTWQLSSGDPLPSGTLLVDNGQNLTWSHRLEYTDSDVYECLVIDLNTGRERSASVDMIIIHDPVLDTIFPAPEISTGSSPAQFIIPLEFTGTVLTCSGFAWPLPSVEWTKDGGALPRGVTAEEIVLPDKGIVVSDLTFSSEFSIVDAGNYQCKVLSTNGDGEMMSQLVELKQGPSTAESSEYMCKSISSDSILFQVRVFTNDCDKWNDDKSEIAEDFENLIIRVVASLCGEECNITNGIITISTLECSTFIQGGVVFRGSIQTESAKQTEAAFCALSQWQRSGSLVSIGMYRYLVDSQCTLQIDSYQDEECVEATAEQELDVMMILLIGIPVVAIVSVVGVVITIVVCSLCFCQCCKREKVSDGTDPYEINTLSYTRTNSQVPPTYTRTDSQAPPITNPSLRREQDNLFYSETLPVMIVDDDRYIPLPSPLYDVALSPDRRPLFAIQPESLPIEQETTFTDSGVSLNMATAGPPNNSGSPPHDPRQTSVATGAQPYQIPTASTSSLNKVGVVNPMWAVNEVPSSQKEERRLSEGPSPGGRQGLSNGTHTTGLRSSTDDYSRLKFSPPKGAGVDGPPQRKWYMTSEPSYASLTEQKMFPSYDYIKNTHTYVSPMSSPQRRMTVPTIMGEPAARGTQKFNSKVHSSKICSGLICVSSGEVPNSRSPNVSSDGAPSNIHHSGPPRVGVTSNIHPPRISSENVPNKTDHYGPPRTTHNIPQQHTNSFHHMKQQLISSV